MYALFGNLNDEATAYQFYQQNGPLQMQAAQAVIVQQGWFTLKQWLLSNAYDLQVRARVCVCWCATHRLPTATAPQRPAYHRSVSSARHGIVSSSIYPSICIKLSHHHGGSSKAKLRWSANKIQPRWG